MSIQLSKFFRRAFIAAVVALLWITFIYLLSAFVAAEFDFRVWDGAGRFVAAIFMGIGALITLLVTYHTVDNFLRYTNY